MTQTKTQPGYKSLMSEVLTLTETAAFLRVSEKSVLELVHKKAIPGQQINGEWRFLKQAVIEWLLVPDEQVAKPGSKEAVLKYFGVFKNDGDLEEQLALNRERRKASEK